MQSKALTVIATLAGLVLFVWLTSTMLKMSVFIAAWIAFSILILGFLGWTISVLMQQKRVWQAFAKRHKLRYDGGKFMDPPTVTGKYDRWTFSLYTGIQQTNDMRGERYVTIMEFQLGSGMPTGGAVATKEFAPFIEGLVFDKVFKPELAEWDGNYVVKCRDVQNMKAWMTKERQQMLSKIFKIKGVASLFFFDQLEAVLRIETSNALKDAAQLEKFVKQLSDAGVILAPSEEERKTFKKLLKEEKVRLENDDPYSDEDDEDDVEQEAEAAQEAEPKKEKEPAAEKEVPQEEAKSKNKAKKKSQSKKSTE